MRNLFVVFAACLGSLFPFGGATIVRPTPSAPPLVSNHVEGEILVKFKAGVSAETIEGINTRQEVKVLGFIEGLGIYRLGLPEGVSVETMMERYRALPEVQYAEPNHKLHILKKEGTTK